MAEEPLTHDLGFAVNAIPNSLPRQASSFMLSPTDGDNASPRSFISAPPLSINTTHSQPPDVHQPWAPTPLPEVSISPSRNANVTGRLSVDEGGREELSDSEGVWDEKPRWLEIDQIHIIKVAEKSGMLIKHVNYSVSSKLHGCHVLRRYSDFVVLLAYLTKRYSFRILPVLPPKKVGGTLLPKFLCCCHQNWELKLVG